MAFHNVQFPEGISYRSRGGAGFSTSVVETDSFATRVNSRTATMRHTYDVVEAIKSYDDLAELKRFHAARRGAANTFRFKDWQDYTTARNGKAAPTAFDEIIGIGDGSATQFKLRKTYDSGDQSTVRLLTLPRTATVLVAVNGIQLSPGTFSVSADGTVTISPALAADTLVQAGCQFDVPVRFGIEADAVLSATLEDVSSGAIPSIPLIEQFDEGFLDEDFFYGGGSVHELAVDMQLSLLDGRAVSIKMTVPGKSVKLPDNSTLPGGGPYFFLHNHGTESWTLKNSGGDTISTVAAGEGRMIALAVDDTPGDEIRRWFAV